MRRALIAAIASLTVLAAAAPAGAHTAAWLPSGEFAGQTAATDRLVLNAIAAADTYWARHGLTAPPAQPLMYDSDVALAQGEQPTPGAPCLGAGGACRVWVYRTNLASVYESAWTGRTRHDRRSGARALCMTITHERGHNHGLGHDHGGVMSRSARTTPECRAVVRAFVPR
jgi:hypothetical protein